VWLLSRFGLLKGAISFAVFSLNGHTQDVHSFLDAQQTLYKLPTIRDAVEEQMDSAPRAGRVAYALACLICLTLVSYCFGEFALLPNEDRQGNSSRQLFAPTA
jgi:hypothetical protein